MLCNSLKIGKKTISELYQHKRSFTIHTAKKFAQFFGLKSEFILMKQIEYDLSLDKEQYKFIKPFSVVALEDKKLNSAKWILATINNSISDKRMHYNIDDLHNIFSSSNIEQKYHYAIITIFKEVMYEDVVKYCELYNIKKINIKFLYEFYKTLFNTKEIKQYEWLLEEF
jgi:plasmid maintenance system antidote protein VapI